MPDAENRGNVPEGEQANSPIEPPPDLTRNHNEPTGSGDYNPTNKENETTAKLEHDIRSGERWLIGIGIATVVINTIIALIYWGQLIQMRKATKAAADSANASLSVAITAVQQMKAAEEANWLNRANSISSERQSKAALEASIEASRTDQRAWIGVTPVLAKNPQASDYIHADIRFKNTGRTPARRVTYDIWPMTSFPLGKKPDLKDINKTGRFVGGFIPPGAEYGVRPGGPLLLSNGGILDRLQLGSERVYVHGKVFYNDVFFDFKIPSQQHWTTFCYYLRYTHEFPALVPGGKPSPERWDWMLCEEKGSNDGN